MLHYLLFDHNEPMREGPHLTLRTALLVVEPHLSDTCLIFSPPHSCQYKQMPDLALPKMDQIFSCNIDFCREQDRKFQHPYFFDLSIFTKQTTKDWTHGWYFFTVPAGLFLHLYSVSQWSFTANQITSSPVLVLPIVQHFGHNLLGTGKLREKSQKAKGEPLEVNDLKSP